MEWIQGKGVCGGMVCGKLHYIHQTKLHTQTKKRSPIEELTHFRHCHEQLLHELAKVQTKAKATAGETEAEIFAIHQMMLTDEEFIEPIELEIQNGKSATQAVNLVGERLAGQFAAMDDSYMQAREADIRAITDRLQMLLSDEDETDLVSLSAEEPMILLAKELTPAQTIGLDTNTVLGFVTEQGTTNSHTAILARTLGIPAIVATGSIPEAFHGKEAILDGENGILYVSPDKEIRQQLAKYQTTHATTQKVMRGHTCQTADGRAIQICANAGHIRDVQAAVAQDAEGIGLFRSEFLFMQTDHCPTEEEQYNWYRQVVEIMQDKDVVIRTLDAGADKKIPWLNEQLPQWQTEENPALGLRALRIGLQHPTLLIPQLRALYRASVHGKLSVMFPLITLPSELQQVRQIAAKVREDLQNENIPHDPHMPLGIMIETPSAALLSDTLAPMADFFSIGTNDLTQYTMAADRENASVAYLTDTVPDSVKKLLHMTITAAKTAEIPVGVCGELAGNTDMLSFWIEEGITKLSVSPGQVLPLRAKVQAYLDEKL